MTESIAIVGCGLVGRTCSTVFARAGYDSVIHDPVKGLANHALELLRKPPVDLLAVNLLRALAVAEVPPHVHSAHAIALDGCVQVQESGLERVEIKRELSSPCH